MLRLALLPYFLWGNRNFQPSRWLGVGLERMKSLFTNMVLDFARDTVLQQKESWLAMRHAIVCEHILWRKLIGILNTMT